MVTAVMREENSLEEPVPPPNEPLLLHSTRRERAHAHARAITWGVERSRTRAMRAKTKFIVFYKINYSLLIQFFCFYFVF